MVKFRYRASERSGRLGALGALGALRSSSGLLGLLERKSNPTPPASVFGLCPGRRSVRVVWELLGRFGALGALPGGHTIRPHLPPKQT